jgi:hypothetical protein
VQFVRHAAERRVEFAVRVSSKYAAGLIRHPLQYRRRSIQLPFAAAVAVPIA